MLDMATNPPDSRSNVRPASRYRRPEHDVAIVGAGPYGLAAASHLRTIRGLDVRVFGEPMAFWDGNMPEGMLLRSNWSATQISSPDGLLSLEAYQSESNDLFSTPVPLASFVGYGRWFQRHAVPDVDPRQVSLVERDGDTFHVRLVDGKTITAGRVLVCAGIGNFARRPPECQHLPPELTTHTSEHRLLRGFAGKSVLVIGGGQSALESAALLYEAGADVEVICREKIIRWLQGRVSKALHFQLGSFTKRLLYAPTDVGPAAVSQLVARPRLLRCWPKSLQEKIRRRCVRPAGARWLVERLRNVPIRTGQSLIWTKEQQGRVRVRLSDGTDRSVDHLLVGTGYRVEIERYHFLAQALLRDVEREDGYPLLTTGLESSVQGLHFLGAPAARAFGPLLQFVSGTTWSSREILRCIKRHQKVFW